MIFLVLPTRKYFWLYPQLLDEVIMGIPWTSLFCFFSIKEEIKKYIIDTREQCKITFYSSNL